MSTTEILIADGSSGRGQRVADALEAAGHSCAVVPHGAAALEVALTDRPRVIVAQFDLPLVDAGKLSEILRANPRTRGARFLFLGAAISPGLLDGIGDVTLPSDAGIDQVLGAIATLLDRQQRIEHLEDRAGAERQFSGALSELRPAEVLQMLHLRRASGALGFEPDEEGVSSEPGLVSLVDGEIVAAVVGPIHGEKALFRMLGWRTGCFVFEPGDLEGGTEITAPTRSVLAEGLRQLDEWDRLAPTLPPLDSPVRLCVERAALPQTVHPLTQEVLRLLEDLDRVGDVVDHSRHPDYQVLRTLNTLAERGIVRFGRARLAAPQPVVNQTALFNEAQCRRLREFAQAGRSREARTPDAKLLVVADDPGGLERFVALLSKVPGVEIAPRMERGELEPRHLEAIGRLDIDGDFGLDLIHLPADRDFAPIWGLAGHHALGTVILLDAGVGESAARLSQVTAALMARPDARTFHVVLLGEGERLSPHDLRENLSLIDDASLFLLPIESSKDPGSLLRSLFARIVP